MTENKMVDSGMVVSHQDKSVAIVNNEPRPELQNTDKPAFTNDELNKLLEEKGVSQNINMNMFDMPKPKRPNYVKRDKRKAKLAKKSKKQNRRK